MKKPFTCLLLFVCITVLSQKREIPENFSLTENNRVVWSKVFQLEGSEKTLVEKVFNFYMTQEFTRKLKLNNGEITGYSNPIKVKPIKGGSFYNPITGFIRVRFKENKYLVELTAIKFEPIDFGVDTGLITVSQTEQFNFEEIVLKQNQQDFKRTYFNINKLKSFDKAFSAQFKFKKVSKDDW